ncbi:hypothetical protein EIP86_009925 [Pleurotus ostreatoroseus]|nr:hypothetical protein EIP86_009925 [Pleurotus ostreatoroseus]
MPAYIPLELVILMLAYLRDDKQSLSHCSLVCRGWAPLAYQHGFRTITVHKPRLGLSIAVDRLLTRLRTVPHLKTYIQELALTANELAPAPHQTLHAGSLRTLLLELNELRILRISHANLVLPSPTIPPALLCTVRKLSVLSLAAMTAPPGAFTLSQVLGLFAEVQELHLDNFASYPLNQAFFRTEAPADHGALSKFAVRHRVKSMAIVNCCPSITMTALWSLRHIVGASSLSGLALQMLDLGALTVLDELIRTTGLVVRHLELNFLRLPLSYDIHSLQYGFDIAALANVATLEAVHLTMILWAHQVHTEKNCALWRCFTAFLAAIAGTVRSVHITLHTAELRTICAAPVTADTALHYLSSLDWKSLEDAMSRSLCLERVSIEAVNGDSEDGRSTWLGEEMRNLVDTKMAGKARALLEFP